MDVLCNGALCLVFNAVKCGLLGHSVSAGLDSLLWV